MLADSWRFFQRKSPGLWDGRCPDEFMGAIPVIAWWARLRTLNLDFVNDDVQVAQSASAGQSLARPSLAAGAARGTKLVARQGDSVAFGVELG
jgi:hypothetical protein